MENLVANILDVFSFLFALVPMVLIIFLLIKLQRGGTIKETKIENMGYNEAFEEMYSKLKQNSSIAKIESLKEKAIKEKKTANTIIWVMVPAVFIIYFLLGNSKSMMMSILFYISIIFVPICVATIALFIAISKGFMRGGSAIVSYVENYKNIVITEILKLFEEKIEYEPRSGIAREVYKEAEFEKFDRYSSDDYMNCIFKNNYRGEIANVHTEYSSEDSDGNTHYYSLFNGLFAKIVLTKEFEESFYLRKDKKYSTKEINPKAEKIELDSQEFERYFDVYSSNKLIAMQLLTADIMQMLINIQEETGLRFELTIKNSKLYIRCYTGEMFETPDDKKEVLDKKTLYRYYKMLEFTFAITYQILKILEETEY